MQFIWMTLAVAVQVAAIIRLVRWLAFVQQKEYRFDRLRAFIKSEVGRSEVRRWWVTPAELSRKGLKRPRRTWRMLSVAVIAVMGMGAGFLALWYLGWASQTWWLVTLVSAMLVLAVPLVVLVAMLPTMVVSNVMVYFMLYRAKKRVDDQRPLIIGIGGCYGKTTTKLILHQVLDAHQPTFTTPKSFNTPYSIARSIIRGYQNQRWMLIEYGSYRLGEIRRLAEIFPPSLALETGYTEQHLDLFGSVEGILQAEGELAAALPNNGVMFCHAADEGAVRIAERGLRASGAQLVPYTGPRAVVELENCSLDEVGALAFSWRGHRIKTPLIGEQYRVNVAAAIAVAEYLGIPEAIIVRALGQLKIDERFIQTQLGFGDAFVVNDGFAANPQGFEAALMLMKSLKRQRRASKAILVFGGIVDLGEKTASIHRRLAQAGLGIIDEVWYTSTTGQAAFIQKYDDHMFVGSDQWHDRLNHLNDQTLILLEGRNPQWLEHVLLGQSGTSQVNDSNNRGKSNP